MKINIPDVSITLKHISSVNSSFMGKSQAIGEWVNEHKRDIQHNLKLVLNKSEENDIEILLFFLRDLLVRAMSGESGERTYNELKKAIKSKKDLRRNVYGKALEKARYRWGVKAGSNLISDVVEYFDKQLNWNWYDYLDRANTYKVDNFSNDYLLTIKGVGFKVRDLALSSFNPYYAAFDLHVARVSTRIGFLNYGYDLLSDPKVEMGNNPADTKNYLFLHKLFLRLSDLTGGEFLPSYLDRAFWHFGRTYCGSTPKCNSCPIKAQCLTGRAI